MITFTAAILLVGVIVYTLGVRAQRLEDRKATIYENLRDLQFEYRVGKLSDQDYQQTKLDLQRELARVLAEIESAGPGSKFAPAAPAPNTCPHCGAKFPKPMKFCGECGKPMLAGAK
jgi:hypothetical protein